MPDAAAPPPHGPIGLPALDRSWERERERERERGEKLTGTLDLGRRGPTSSGPPCHWIQDIVALELLHQGLSVPALPRLGSPCRAPRRGPPAAVHGTVGMVERREECSGAWWAGGGAQ